MNFFYGDYRPTTPPALPVYPAGGDPGHPVHPDGLHTTGHAPTHTPGRWTRCTGLHSIPDKPRLVDQDGGGTGECAIPLSRVL
nr:MAG TPA: hypothetical protein [Caudoviricetes sp.]